MLSVRTVDRHGFAGVELRDEAAGSVAQLTLFGLNVYSWRISAPTRSSPTSLPRDPLTHSSTDQHELIYADPDFPKPSTRPVGSGIPILAPFPNRIAKGEFSFSGKKYALPRNEQSGVNAIHGFAANSIWRELERGAGFVPEHAVPELVDASLYSNSAWVVAEFQLSKDRPDMLANWPSDVRMRVTYLLRGRQLISWFEVENPDTQPLPFGFGTHGYFRFPLNQARDESACTITVPAARLVELDACIPTGNLFEITPEKDLRHATSWADRTIDDIYTSLKSTSHPQAGKELIGFGEALVLHELRDNSAGITLRLTHATDFQHAVIYIPPHRKAICIEPYTCLTNAINASNPNDAGLLVLPPAESDRSGSRMKPSSPKTNLEKRRVDQIACQ